MAETSKHLTPEDCAAMMRGEMPPREEAGALLEHLLGLCPQCLEAWHAYYQKHRRTSSGDAADSPAPGNEEAARKAVRSVLKKLSGLRERIAQEEDKAPKLLAELDQLADLPARVVRVRRSKRFRSWVLCEKLLHRSLSLSFEHPEEAAEAAELAIETVWALDDTGLGSELISDLIARGWAALAHARRLGGQPRLALETFAMAGYFREQGTGDPLVEAEIVGLQALLRRQQGELEEAARLHDRAVNLYRRLEMDQPWGNALLQRAVTRATARRLDAAVSDLRQCLELLDAERDPRLHLCAEHTLILYLYRLDQRDEALRRYEELAKAESRPTDPWAQLRRRWLAVELGQPAATADRERLESESSTDPALSTAAEAAFHQAHWGLVEAGIYHRNSPPPNSLLTLLAEARVS